MRDLVLSLVLKLDPLREELPLVYDLAYSTPGPTGDEPKVRVSKVDATAPEGNAEARELLAMIQRHTDVCIVRLAYVADLHRLPRPAIPQGMILESYAKRLEVVQNALAALYECEGLRDDAPTREHMTLRGLNPPCVADAVESLAYAHSALLPRATPAELAALTDELCRNCNARPQMNGRKRCNACHTYFAKHKRERPAELWSAA